ncbi:MAG: delta 1-pyrroline-5-carboxylate reductase [Watsoniomyces obsoletus]|nr:MAG: delta 1-pyrroline-5-carboxylate reductase [Watsoniomyces obsoletus]
MADPFEVRMRFTSQLQHLNASVTSSQKAAHYALKYKDMDEDLHSCILEQLERNSMNTRANIMYFIEHLCDMAQRESHLEYIRMIQRDILRVVDAVAPEDGSGAANVKVIRRVLNGLQSKSILDVQTVSDIEACLKERDTLPSSVVLSPIQASMDPSRVSTTTGDVAGNPEIPPPKTSPTDRDPPSYNHENDYNDNKNNNTNNNNGIIADPNTSYYKKDYNYNNGTAPPLPIYSTAGATTTTTTRLDKKQIEQRIEEDRERHKRLRESIWSINPEEDAEFDQMWEVTSDLGEEDFRMMQEEKMERDAAAKAWATEKASRKK